MAGRKLGIMSNKMWGGRFSERPDEIMEEINVSIDVDRHLYAQDIAASKAHAAMLAERGIITANDAKNIGKGWMRSSPRSRRGRSISSARSRTFT